MAVDKKYDLLKEMNRAEVSPLWLHPTSIPLIRSNYPNLPIAVARDHRMMWFLNGNKSFIWNEENPLQQKLTTDLSEYEVRRALKLNYDYSTKYESTSIVYLEDALYNQIKYNSRHDYMNTVSAHQENYFDQVVNSSFQSLYCSDGMMMWCDKVEKAHKGYSYRMDHLRPHFFLNETALLGGLSGKEDWIENYVVGRINYNLQKEIGENVLFTSMTDGSGFHVHRLQHRTFEVNELDLMESRYDFDNKLYTDYRQTNDICEDWKEDIYEETPNKGNN